MNIFVLSSNPVASAKMHCDKHVVKMIVEYAQLLSTAHRVLDNLPQDSPYYKATHANHPAAVWVRQNDSNYNWLFQLFCACLNEYTLRYGKQHATGRLKECLSLTPLNISVAELTIFPQTMPDEFKVVGNPIQAYRNFYALDKVRFAKWTNRRPPSWFIALANKSQNELWRIR